MTGANTRHLGGAAGPPPAPSATPAAPIAARASTPSTPSTPSKRSSVVLSRLEFDVLWECERLPQRHPALDVPSPGRTAEQRRSLVDAALRDLGRRGLTSNGRAVRALADDLTLLAHHERAIDAWVWTDRQISGLAVGSGTRALLCVVDGDEVWLIPARATALAEAAVSVAGPREPGNGGSVSVPFDALQAADREAAGNPSRLITQLESRGVPLADCQQLAGMLAGARLRAQFGFQRRRADGRSNRADRVVGLHDTPSGRYLFLTTQSTDGRMWCTVAPAHNARIASCVWELTRQS